jgi:hypothetical protein
MYYMEKIFILSQLFKKDEDLGGKTLREAPGGASPALRQRPFPPPQRWKGGDLPPLQALPPSLRRGLIHILNIEYINLENC